MLNEVLGKIEEARKLEKDAAEDPGVEASHDFEPSKAYDDYRSVHWSVKEAIDLLSPQEWVSFFNWTLENPHYFGGAAMAGSHRSPCGWEPKARSVRTLLLLSMRERTKGKENRREYREVWGREDIVEMLSHPSWLEQVRTYDLCDREEMWDDLIAGIISTTRCEKLLEATEGTRIGEMARDLLDPSRLFRIDSFKFEPSGGDIKAIIGYTCNMKVENSSGTISLSMDGKTVSIFDVIFTYQGKKRGICASSEFERADVVKKNNSIEVSISRENWDSIEVPSGLEVSVWVDLVHVGRYRSEHTARTP